MPYKDKKKKKEYQRIWISRKRRGLPTRTKPEISSEERLARKKKSKKMGNKKAREKRQNKIREAFGTKCFFCDLEDAAIMHRKDGAKHKLFGSMSLHELDMEIQYHKNEYVRVCKLCHKGIHWAMKRLNLTWDDIVSLSLSK